VSESAQSGVYGRTVHCPQSMGHQSWWYAVERVDGKQIAVYPTRHDAVGVIARCYGGQRDWYSVEPINPLSWLWWSPRYTMPDFEPRWRATYE